MKRMMTLAMALVMVFLLVPGLAADVQNSSYSLAPANPTQENVEKIDARYQPEENDPVPCIVTVMEPTQLTVDTLKEIFEFVGVDEQSPARYFPEDVQKEMAEIINGDPDALYMTEFMSLLPEEMQLDADVLVDMHMYIDYKKGQLVLPVLGRQTEEKIEWKPLPAQVFEQTEEDNIIYFAVPKEVAKRYAGAETLFALLAAKPSDSGEAGNSSSTSKEEFVPSKNASDIVFVTDDKVRNENGEVVDCKIIIVSKSKPIEWELAELTEYFIRPENIPIRYFDEETVQETTLILNDIDVDTLLPYEITQVMAVDYQQPYGDVTATFLFPTPFRPEKAMIALIGIPDEVDKTIFHWMPLRAELTEKGVDITFSSSVLPTMMEEAALLLLMSEPLEERFEEYHEKRST